MCGGLFTDDTDTSWHLLLAFGDQREAAAFLATAAKVARRTCEERARPGGDRKACAAVMGWLEGISLDLWRAADHVALRVAVERGLWDGQPSVPMQEQGGKAAATGESDGSGGNGGGADGSCGGDDGGGDGGCDGGGSGGGGGSSSLQSDANTSDRSSSRGGGSSGDGRCVLAVPETVTPGWGPVVDSTASAVVSVPAAVAAVTAEAAATETGQATDAVTDLAGAAAVAAAALAAARTTVRPRQPRAPVVAVAPPPPLPLLLPLPLPVPLAPPPATCLLRSSS